MGAVEGAGRVCTLAAGAEGSRLASALKDSPLGQCNQMKVYLIRLPGSRAEITSSGATGPMPTLPSIRATLSSIRASSSHCLPRLRPACLTR